MNNPIDKKQVLTWSLIILAIVGLFVGLAFLGGKNGGGQAGGTLAVPVNEATDHIRGPATAKATLVEYSDFQCPACAQYEPIVREVASSFPNDLRVVYRHFPLTEIHKNATAASIASEAASKQGKFWEMHDILFDRQSQWSNATSTDALFSDFAVSLGLNTDQFVKDLTESATSDKIDSDVVGANASGITGTPTFYLNGKQIRPKSLEEFKTLVQKALENAQ